MDLPVQHDFTLARLWAWMKVELSEQASFKDVTASKETSKSAVSGIDRQESEVLPRFSHNEKEIGSTVDVSLGKASGSSSASSSTVTGKHPSTTPDSLISASFNNFDVTPMLQVYSPLDVEDYDGAMQEESQEEEPSGESSVSTEPTSSSGSVLSEVETSNHTSERIISPIVDPPLNKVTERSLPQIQLWTKPDAEKDDNESRSRRTDEVSEEMEKKKCNEYDIKLRAEIEKLSHAHQEEIEQLKQACTAETSRANQIELERRFLAKELAHQKGLVAQKDKVIADKDGDAMNAFVAADTLHAQLCGNVPCVGLIRKLHQTEMNLRIDLRIVVEQNGELQQSLKMANERMKQGKAAMSRLRLELKDQAASLRQTTELLRADEIKSAFLDVVQENTAEMISLKARLKSRTQEIQGLHCLKSRLEKSIDNYVAERQEGFRQKLSEERESLLDEIDIWRNDFNHQGMEVRRLNADKARLETEKDSLMHKIEAYSTEEEDMEAILDQITANTQAIFTADGKEAVQPPMHFTKANRILSHFQDMLYHFQAKIAILQEGDRHKAGSSREVHEYWGSSLGNSRGEDTAPSKGAEDLEASLSGGVVLDSNLGGPAEQGNELANSDDREFEWGHQPATSTDYVALDSQAPVFFTQTPTDTAFGFQSTSQLSNPAPKTSIDPGSGKMSSGPIFKFASAQNPSGTQSGLAGGTTQQDFGLEQAQEGQSANIDTSFPHPSAVFNGGVATTRKSRETLGPKLRVSKPGRRGGAK